MTKIIAIANQKGGVGKTTTAVNLTASLAATKRSMLLIDIDPQGNATMGSGINKSELNLSVCDVLQSECTMKEAILTTPEAGYDILPANGDLTAAEINLVQREGREQILRKAIATIDGKYDYIIIDCPPTLNMLTLNALVASDSVLITMQCEYFALEGLTGLVQTIEHIKASVNPRLQIEGILRTMYDGRNRLATEVSQQLKQHFGSTVYRTVIPRNVRLAEAPSFGVPVLLHDKRSQGAAAYLALAGEVLRREELNAASQKKHGQQQEIEEAV